MPKGTEAERAHLAECKEDHWWCNPFLDKDVPFEQEKLLICKGTNQYVDLDALGNAIGKLFPDSSKPSTPAIEVTGQ